MASSYLQHPHLHGEQLAFVTDDDLWLAPVAGGAARRAASVGAPIMRPRFSPDGTRIAFTAGHRGDRDVYVREADGSVVRRTWLSDAAAQVQGWDGEDLIITVASRSPQRSAVRAHRLSPDGALEPLPWGIVGSAALGDDGALAVATPGVFGGASYWKRYRGGTAAQLFLRRAEQWQRVLPEETASLEEPTWAGGRLFFTSDMTDGTGRTTAHAQAQLWSVGPDGADLTQHTRHGEEDGYVRQVSSDGERVVLSARGRLFLLKSAEEQPVEIEIATGLGAPQPSPLKPTQNLGDPVPDHGANGSLLAWQGGAFWLTHRAGPARALADDSGARIREPELLGRTGKAVWVTDADGEDALEIAQIDGSGERRRIAGGALGRVLHLRSNPAGDRLAVISHDGRVSLVDLDGEVRQLTRSTEGEAVSPVFSPDGRYLVWCSPVGQEAMLRQVLCAEVETGQVHALTSGRYCDASPAFTADGKHLLLISARTLDPAYDEVTFDLHLRNARRPWLVPLRADQPAPFGDAADGWPLSEAADGDAAPGAGADGADASADGAVATVTIDIDGFEERMVPFPVPSGSYRSLQATRTGVLWLHRTDDTGVLGSGRAGVEGERPAPSVEHYDLTTRRLTTVCEGADLARVSGDGERIIVRKGEQMWVQPAASKPGEDDGSRVEVDLARLRRRIDPRAQWRQMFEENGRIMRDHYWREDMEGVDWQAVLARYRPLLERVRTRTEFEDVLWETVAELNTSHAYVFGPEQDSSERVGRLGADLTRDAEGWRIQQLLPGESSDPEARSPLRAAGVDARAGDLLVAIDGRPTAEVASLGELLVGAVDTVVELTLRRDGQERRVAVRPVASEAALRYHQWVESRAAYVREHSHGRLGYVHIPDMGASGWAEFHRHIEQASLAEGVVVDVRFNGGGHTSQLLIERLSRRVLGWGHARHFASPMTYPAQAMRGPVVLVTNQFAGSDGDIVSGAAQVMGLGPVVGQRSWGGVVGIDGRFSLVDGTSITQPRYSHWFQGGGYGMENHGADPDIVVNWGPTEWEDAYCGGADTQLDAAIAEALQRLEQTPAAVPPALDPPRWA